MLIVIYGDLGQEDISSRYMDKINNIPKPEKYDNNNIIKFLEQVSFSLKQYEITIVPYFQNLLVCLDTLHLSYELISKVQQEKDELLQQTNKNVLYLDNSKSLEKLLSEKYEWFIIKEEQIVPDKNSLTLEQLVDNSLIITESDVRDLKATQNKLKVGMLLQAKSSLNRVLKLTKILDKLYDELLNRIEDSLTTSDTASLAYTTEYIAKALNDTNQFIISTINNEKIQNFFIIDNSKVININDDRVEINKREKIRKAVEVVLNNLDYLESGDYNKLQNPNNVIEVKEDDKNAK